jgi:diketogulonate reductase-like aldo/keto reductase
MEIASGVQMPIISSGAWTTYTTKGNTTAIVSDWLRHGGRAINTALFNGDLRDVAKAIEDTHISRKDIFIATMIPGCDDVQSCIDTELKQLNTSFLDLLLIPSTFGKPFSDAWRTLEENIYHGKLKSIGVSNFNKKQLQEIWHKATIKPAVNQISYNVFRHDEDTIAFCRAHNITIEALSPFGYHDGHLNKKSVFTEPIVLSIAKVHNVTPVQVALKWIVQRGDAVAVLSSNVFPAENADLWKFTLSDDEMTKLDSIASSHGQIQSVESTRMPNQHSLELTVV